MANNGLTGRKPGNRRLYPWEKWFKQDVFTIRRNVDYHVGQASMYQMCRSAAGKYGVVINIKDMHDHLIITVIDRKNEGIENDSGKELTVSYTD